MKLGRVIGKIWSERKVEQLKTCRLFIVQPLHSDYQNKGKTVVVADPQNIASTGDIIVYVTSTDAAQAFDTGYAPVNASIVQLVDTIQ